MLELQPKNFEKYYENVTKVEFKPGDNCGFFIHFPGYSYTFLKIDCEKVIECDEHINLYRAFVHDSFNTERLFEIDYSTHWGSCEPFIEIIKEYTEKE